MKHILEVDELSKHYTHKRGAFSSQKNMIKAVDNVSFYVNKGEVLGLVGESGCGKTTTGKCVLNLIRPTAGKVRLNGEEINHLSEEQMRPYRQRMQMVFQDAMSCLDPRWRIGKSLSEPIGNFNKTISIKEVNERIEDLLHLVGLPKDAQFRLPHEFSGGQRQRIGIAKAMSLNPEFIVCDEPVSALDVSIQAQILNLFITLREQFNLSYLFVSHDLAVVKYISDRVAVMYAGKIVEIAAVEDFFKCALHPYSVLLISAVPNPDPSERYHRLTQPSVEIVANNHTGCNFYGRCPRRTERCLTNIPELQAVQSGHQVACFHPS